MRQKGSFLNWYKIMGIIKALKCCQNLYQEIVCPCPVFLFFFVCLFVCFQMIWVDLDHFYDSVKFNPDASVWVTAYRALSALTCISKFALIQHILSTKVSDTGPMVLWLWRTDENYPSIIIKYPPYLVFCTCHFVGFAVRRLIIT